MDRNSSTVNIIILAVVAIIAILLILPRVDQALKNQAIADCAKATTYTRTTENEKVSAPLENLYNSCLQEKGYK